MLGRRNSWLLFLPRIPPKPAASTKPYLGPGFVSDETLALVPGANVIMVRLTKVAAFHQQRSLSWWEVSKYRRDPDGKV
jgi:hypothetical protein